MMKKHCFVLVACARWESLNIVEWLDYHRFIGFDHAYIYCNDDDPEDLYERLYAYIASGFVTFRYYAYQGMQEMMYRDFLRKHLWECEWFSFLDIDEYLLIRKHFQISDFIFSMRYAVDAVHFHSVDAGNMGYVTRPNGSVIANYTKRSGRASGFTKSVVRSAAVDLEKVPRMQSGAWHHHIEAILGDETKTINVLGKSMKGYYQNHGAEWANMNTTDFHEAVIANAFIYHIGIKSEEDIIRRFKRGIGGNFHSQQSWKILWETQREAVLESLAKNNEIDERHLIEVRRKMLSASRWNEIIPPQPLSENLALKGIASQSSVSIHSKHQDTQLDAGGIINGAPSGWHQHSTAVEEQPWWQVDLGSCRAIGEVRIFNRMDASQSRFRNFVLSSSMDSLSWIELERKNDDIPFGGVDGTMFIWRSSQAVQSRYVRIQALSRCLLDLDQVEIFEDVKSDR